MNSHRIDFITKSDYIELVSRVYSAQMESDKNDPWHVEDLETYLEITIQTITKTLVALDEMGYRSENNGNWQS